MIFAKRKREAAAKRAEGKPVSFKITSAADIDIKSIPTRRQSQINWITRDHVRGACKVAVRLLGESAL